MGSELELMREIRNSHALKPDTVKEQEEDYVEVCTRETMERDAQLAAKSSPAVAQKRRGRPKKAPEATKKEITQVEKLEKLEPAKPLKTRVVRESRNTRNTRKQHKETNTMKVKKTRKRSAVAKEAPETLPFAGQQMYTVTVVGGISIPGFKLKQGEKLAIAKLIPVKVN